MFLTFTFFLIIITLFAYFAIFAILFSIVDFYEKPQSLEALYTFTLIVISVITLEIIDGFDNEFLFLTLSLIYFGAIIVFYIYVLIQLENKEEKKQKLPFQFMIKNIPWALLFSTWFLINWYSWASIRFSTAMLTSATPNSTFSVEVNTDTINSSWALEHSQHASAAPTRAWCSNLQESQFGFSSEEQELHASFDEDRELLEIGYEMYESKQHITLLCCMILLIILFAANSLIKAKRKHFQVVNNIKGRALHNIIGSSFWLPFALIFLLETQYVFNESYLKNIFKFFPLSIICIIALLAETNRVPFDLPEAEAELVAGYNVEYGGFLFALFMIAEYTSIAALVAFMHLVFFNSLSIGFDQNFFLLDLFDVFYNPLTIFSNQNWVNLDDIQTILSWVFLIFVVISIRALLPRYRYDQLMSIGWKTILPVILAIILFEICYTSTANCAGHEIDELAPGNSWFQFLITQYLRFRRYVNSATYPVAVLISFAVYNTIGYILLLIITNMKTFFKVCNLKEWPINFCLFYLQPRNVAGRFFILSLIIAQVREMHLAFITVYCFTWFIIIIINSKEFERIDYKICFHDIWHSARYERDFIGALRATILALVLSVNTLCLSNQFAFSYFLLPTGVYATSMSISKSLLELRECPQYLSKVMILFWIILACHFYGNYRLRRIFPVVGMTPALSKASRQFATNAEARTATAFKNCSFFKDQQAAALAGQSKKTSGLEPDQLNARIPKPSVLDTARETAGPVKDWSSIIDIWFKLYIATRVLDFGSGNGGTDKATANNNFNAGGAEKHKAPVTRIEITEASKGNVNLKITTNGLTEVVWKEPKLPYSYAEAVKKDGQNPNIAGLDGSDQKETNQKETNQKATNQKETK